MSNVDGFDVRFDFKEVDKALKQLPIKMRNKALRKALRAAGRVYLAPMRAVVPERLPSEAPESTSLPPGALKRDLRVETRLNSQGGTARTGPTSDTGMILNHLNFGWHLTGHKPQKKVIRDIEGTNILEGVFDANSEMALRVFGTVLTEALGLGDDSGESTSDSNPWSGGEYY